MVETFKSTKRSLARNEVKICHSRGACWTLWVTKVCCELLVNGSPPSAIPSSIGTLFAMLYGKEPKKIPSLPYVCQCCVLIQIISETITAMKLDVCPTCAEIFFDATTQRQVPFLAFVISLMGDGPESINPIIVLSCIVLEDETSETHVDGIVSKVRAAIIRSYWVMLQKTNHFPAKLNSLKKRLQQLHEIVLHDYSALHESIPSPDGIDIKKLGQHGVIMMDSCNPAQKTRRLLQHEIGGDIVEIDCYHHLQNVWIKVMEKSVSVFLQVVVSNSIENIPPELWVTCIFSAIACAWDNFFSLCTNYPKGQGEHFTT